MSWLPVANSHGTLTALFSISPKYWVQTVGSKLSNPLSAVCPVGVGSTLTPWSANAVNVKGRSPWRRGAVVNCASDVVVPSASRNR
jgi:hypothetical protein